MNKQLLFFGGLVSILAVSCQQKEEDTLFRLLSSDQTGIDFRNDLKFDQKFNVYTYRNYYNGGGVAVGDINQDGLPDLYFSANLLPNKLYLNKGNFQFEDITEKAGVAGTKAWATGVNMVDINGDGLLDIYVCNSGDIAGDNKENELFINNGDLTFTESAAAFGLNDEGYSTHASFFDFDKDGDLDVYILNNSYQAIGSFNLKKNERPVRDKLGGDKLMRNDGNVFIDVSEEAGIYGSVIGFGLGVTVGDVNGDGWEDIYVCNDFFERDYLYINQQDGTFSEELTSRVQSISGASMGADMADINNDGQLDLFVTEMLPATDKRKKTVTTFEDWTRYQYGLQNGYYHQFTRNTFQLNTGAGTFSEIGRLSGVEATDWSWGALIFDMDNDGLNDLFVANGIYQDLTDQDYLQYVSNEEVIKSILSDNQVDYKKLIDIIPSNPVPNHAFKNQGNLKFEDQARAFGLDQPGFSNGSAYADLDNDGDLDLVVNNVNMQSFVYENTASGRDQSNYLKLILEGASPNTQAIGAKIEVKTPTSTHFAQLQPARGFQSTVDPRPNIGLPTSEKVDVFITWPSGKVTSVQDVTPNQTLVVSEQMAHEPKEQSGFHSATVFTKSPDPVDFVHSENEFVDFNRDRLLYHMNSTEGPKMAKGDINGDGFADYYIGGARDQAGRLLLGGKAGFSVRSQEVFDSHAISEDAGSVFFDADGDGDLDLYVCSGGVEFSQTSSAYRDRLYINDGKGNFSVSDQMLPTSSGYVSSSTVIASDIDADGDLDLFVGERVKPVRYGMVCGGLLLENDGLGGFTEISRQVAPDLTDLGMITDAVFADVDQDGDDDLVIVGEYMGVEIFQNDGGKFTRVETNLERLNGWWNALHVVDIDGDGDLDLIGGNHGLNSKFRASAERPITLYLDDFDQNGFLDPILTFRAADDKDYPYALRHNLIDQMKGLKKRFPDYQSYGTATIEQVLDPKAIDKARKLTVTMLETVLLVNEGNFQFKKVTLPLEAQFAPVYAIATGDFDQDGNVDILLGGNLFATKPEVGRYDGSRGVFLRNKGNYQFEAPRQGAGFWVEGEIREIVVEPGRVIAARNNDSLVVFQYGQQ